MCSTVLLSNETRLRGPDVGAGLEGDMTIPPLPNLLVREVPLVFGRHFRPEGWSLVVWVLLRRPPERKEAQRHLRDVPRLEQVRSLENFLVRYPVLFGGRKE